MNRHALPVLRWLVNRSFFVLGFLAASFGWLGVFTAVSR